MSNGLLMFCPDESGCHHAGVPTYTSGQRNLQSFKETLQPRIFILAIPCAMLPMCCGRNSDTFISLLRTLTQRCRVR